MRKYRLGIITTALGNAAVAIFAKWFNQKQAANISDSHSHCDSDQTKSICKAHFVVETMPETGKFEPLVVQIRRFHRVHEMFGMRRCKGE